MGRDDAGRFTTHKVRAEWFQDRTSYPFRDVYPNALSAERPTVSLTWNEIGPMDIGGRLTSVVVHPEDPKRVYVGAAGGGVWRSPDAGKSWEQFWDDRERTLIIGSMAIDPNPPYWLYCGTGEANLSGDNYPGSGFYRTDPDSMAWVKLGVCETRHVDNKQGLTSVEGIPRRIGTIAIDPFNSKRIFIGSVTHSPAEAAGLHLTEDGGNSWIRAGNRKGAERIGDRLAFVSSSDFRCHSVVFHPTLPGWVFAAVEARGMQSGIWISSDSGQTWRQARVGLPSADRFGRTSLTVAPDSKVIYALVGETTTDAFLGVYRSDDLGGKWARFHCSGIDNEGQLSYTNCIAVDPADPRIVFAGSVNLYRSGNSGRNWRRAAGHFAPRGSGKQAHADHHALAIVENYVYSANDGGLAVSENRGRTWENRNNGLRASMFYDLDVAAKDSGCLGGGLQDHGSWFLGPLNRRDRDLKGKQLEKRTKFRQQLHGDGGWTLYDPDDETHVFGSEHRMDIYRHRDGRRWKRLPTPFPDAHRKKTFLAVLAMDTSVNAKKPRAIYAGSTHVWKSTDDGDKWKQVSPSLDGSVITAIEVAPADPNRVYVGTTKGGFFRSFDAGKKWTRNLAGPSSAGRTITRIETAPHDALQVYYTIGVVAQEIKYEEKPPKGSRLERGGRPAVFGGESSLVEFHHLHHSGNGGDSWDDPTGGQLPNVPHQALVHTPEGFLIVAHDCGVMARDLRLRGLVWRDVTGDLPHVRITDLVYHEEDRLLFVSTYGRGIWSIGLDQLVAVYRLAAV